MEKKQLWRYQSRRRGEWHAKPPAAFEDYYEGVTSLESIQYSVGTDIHTAAHGGPHTTTSGYVPKKAAVCAEASTQEQVVWKEMQPLGGPHNISSGRIVSHSRDSIWNRAENEDEGVAEGKPHRLTAAWVSPLFCTNKEESGNKEGSWNWGAVEEGRWFLVFYVFFPLLIQLYF